MDRDSLALLLGQGVSVEQIAKRFGKDPSTVSYWMRKHGLVAPNREKYAAKGGIERERLEPLVDAGKSIAVIAELLQRSPSTVRHWLAKYELRTKKTIQRGITKQARDQGLAIVQRHCGRHGLTDFCLEGRGAYRCMRCRQEAVSRRRRKVKGILVREAGGTCAICGYSRYIGALHFHHLDPALKRFSVSADGVARSLARARVEADKCVLLCSNCHAEVEAGVAKLPA